MRDYPYVSNQQCQEAIEAAVFNSTRNHSQEMAERAIDTLFDRIDSLYSARKRARNLYCRMKTDKNKETKLAKIDEMLTKELSKTDKQLDYLCTILEA